MYPILFEWGTIVIPAWHTFYVLGAIAAYGLLVALGRRYTPEIPEPDLARLYIVCYIAGYVGARLLSILIEEPQTQGIVATLSALARLGPMTFYGGAIASVLAGAIYARLRHLPLATIFDLALPAGLLALTVGRIGCFLNGDDYGLPVRPSADGRIPFYGMVFPNLKDGVARHPAQLYEAVSVALLVVTLVFLFPKLRQSFKPGIVGLLAIIGYANLRFVLEFTRGDFRGFAFGTWMSTSQFISIVVLLACGLTLPYWLKKDNGELT